MTIHNSATLDVHQMAIGPHFHHTRAAACPSIAVCSLSPPARSLGLGPELRRVRRMHVT